MLAEFEQRYPQLEVRSFEVSANVDNQRRLAAMAAKFRIEPTGGAGLLGAQHWVGYSKSVTPGCWRPRYRGVCVRRLRGRRSGGTGR